MTRQGSLRLRDRGSGKSTEAGLTAYLHCTSQAYLLLTGVGQEPSAYEPWLQRHDQASIAAATRVLLEREEAWCLPRHTPLTSAHLTQGLTTILGAHVEEAAGALAFHALHRVPGAAARGPFHSVPGLFCGTGPAVRATQPLLLACGTLGRARRQQVRPPSGIVIGGDAYNARRVDLGAQ
jgi:hypothetical protein